MCENANAVAAARDDTSSLAKMFWTCRATVCSLMNNSTGDLTVALAAGDQSKHLEFAASQPVGIGGRRSVAPTSKTTRARSGTAPRLSNAYRAASSSSVAVSWSAIARQARPMLTGRARSHKGRRAPSISRARAGERSARRPRGRRRATSRPGRVRPSRQAFRNRDVRGGFIELATGSAREVEAADGDHDLHVGGQRARPPQRRRRLTDEPAHRGCGSVSAFPWASRISAKPGWGSHPFRLA